MKTVSKPKRTILAMDDDDVNLAILVKIAEGAGYIVKPFLSTESAWEFLEKNPQAIDIAVLDKMMPKVSGMEMLRRMKASPSLKHIPVIMQTGDVGTDQMREGLENGAYYYLTKPFAPQILTAILNSAENECNLRADLVAQLTSGHSKFINMLQEGEFNFRTHGEARLLAVTLAQASGCPELIARGLMELFYNAVEHGCLEIGYQAKSTAMLEKRWWQEVGNRISSPGSKYRIAQAQVRRNQSAISVVITDPGKGFNSRYYLESASSLKLNAPSGRGIVIAERLLGRLHYNSQGNEVHCSFPVKGYMAALTHQSTAQETVNLAGAKQH